MIRQQAQGQATRNGPSQMMPNARPQNQNGPNNGGGKRGPPPPPVHVQIGPAQVGQRFQPGSRGNNGPQGRNVGPMGPMGPGRGGPEHRGGKVMGPPVMPATFRR